MMKTTLTRSAATALALLLASLAPSAGAQEQETPPPAKPDQPPAVEENRDVAYVKMETTQGDIILELDREKAPISVRNFLQYAKDEHYDGTIFHRVIPRFMIQGGGMTRDMKEKGTREPIQNEWRNGLKNKRGTIAMARLGGRPDSATSQFFINVADNAFLDEPRDGSGYAVFGKVVAGMTTVDKIVKVPTASRGMHQDVPVDPVIIEKVREIPEDEAKKIVEAEKEKSGASSGG
jgi:cyclophilin family peptidyl-prolyl cis-trans isomerase